jgi:hypothetical protein
MSGLASYWDLTEEEQAERRKLIDEPLTLGAVQEAFRHPASYGELRISATAIALYGRVEAAQREAKAAAGMVGDMEIDPSGTIVEVMARVRQVLLHMTDVAHNERAEVERLTQEQKAWAADVENYRVICGLVGRDNATDRAVDDIAAAVAALDTAGVPAGAIDDRVRYVLNERLRWVLDATARAAAALPSITAVVMALRGGAFTREQLAEELESALAKLRAAGPPAEVALASLEASNERTDAADALKNTPELNTSPGERGGTE